MKISQREARRLRKRVEQMEYDESRRITRYSAEYPGGVNIATLGGLESFDDGKLAAASLLGCAIVGRWHDSTKRLLIYAILPKP